MLSPLQKEAGLPMGVNRISTGSSGASLTSCPDTFHQCPRSASRVGFGVVDLMTGEAASSSSEAGARQDAERLYPATATAARAVSIPRGAP